MEKDNLTLEIGDIKSWQERVRVAEAGYDFGSSEARLFPPPVADESNERVPPQGKRYPVMEIMGYSQDMVYVPFQPFSNSSVF